MLSGQRGGSFRFRVLPLHPFFGIWDFPRKHQNVDLLPLSPDLPEWRQSSLKFGPFHRFMFSSF